MLAQPISPDAVTLKVPTRELEGKRTPTLEVHVNHPIASWAVKLDRDDGERYAFSGRERPGAVKRFPLPQPAGTRRYQGALEVSFPDGQVGTLPLDFSVQVLPGLALTLREEDVDLEKRSLTFTLSRPAKRAELTVEMDTGDLAFDGEVALHGEPAGTPIRLGWPSKPGRVLRIHLTAYDTSDFYDGVELTPWEVRVPHEDVGFLTGSAEIPKAERGKLDESAAKISDALKKYGRLAKIQLYVVGHTDTVGSEADNLALSAARARSIARYLRQRRLKLPIFFTGVGEALPAVPTPDETDEARNRRAEYILALDPPTLPGVEPAWQRP